MRNLPASVGRICRLRFVRITISVVSTPATIRPGMKGRPTILLIAPYRHEGMWVFDDPKVGLDKEPFISGIDTMIDRVVASIPNAERGFRLLFSTTPFPDYTVKLEWRREENGGNWYYSPQFS